MPQPVKNAPDYVDLQNLLGVIGESYALVVRFSVRVGADRVEVIGKAYGAPYQDDTPVSWQALASFELKRPRDMAQTMYTVAFDIWCQVDGGGATAAKRGPSFNWNGRVEKVRRRTQV